MSYNIGTEVFIEVKGQKYRLPRQSRKVAWKLRDWIFSKLPNPLLEAQTAIHGFPPNLQEIIVKDAIALSHTIRSETSPEFLGLLHSSDGALKGFCYLIMEGTPTISEEQAETIFDDCLTEHGIEYLQKKIEETEGSLPTTEAEAEKAFLVEKGLLEKEPEKKG